MWKLDPAARFAERQQAAPRNVVSCRGSASCCFETGLDQTAADEAGEAVDEARDIDIPGAGSHQGLGMRQSFANDMMHLIEPDARAKPTRTRQRAGEQAKSESFRTHSLRRPPSCRIGPLRQFGRPNLLTGLLPDYAEPWHSTANPTT